MKLMISSGVMWTVSGCGIEDLILVDLISRLTVSKHPWSNRPEAIACDAIKALVSRAFCNPYDAGHYRQIA
jgi:hypothetical protein